MAKDNSAQVAQLFNEIRDQRDAAIAERARYGDMMTERLGKCENERDALREQVLRLRDACESVAQNMEASGKLWTPWHTSITVIRLRDALDMTAPQDK